MKRDGFTLMEMVVTLVIGSFIMLGIAAYVKLGLVGYRSTTDAERLQSQSQFVIEKMSREIRHAVPNSFDTRVTASQSCLSFFPIQNSGIYTTISNDIAFTGENLATNLIGLQMIVNPTNRQDFNSPPSALTISTTNMDVLSGYNLLKGAASSLSSNSISERFYLYNPNRLIEYCVGNGTMNQQITRTVGTGASVQVAEDVASLNGDVFNYTASALQTGGVIHINLAFENEGSVSSHYQQDVQVLNVP